MAATALTPVQLKLQRKNALFNERASWMTHWQEISQYQQPRAGRFVVSDRNKGEKRHNLIYDRTPIGAQRTLAAGLMSGMTSPARPWFRLTLNDPVLRELGPVKSWLHQSTLLVREIFSVSNTYRALQQGYGELGLFGTWAAIVMQDFDNVMHIEALTVGEYALGVDDKGKVNALAREFDMTVGQMVERFGRDNCSTNVQTLFDRGDLDQWCTVIHIIEPNPHRDASKRDSKNMRWSSCYIERGVTDKFLSESGFKKFRVLAPRWETTGGDIYGSSPGMEALGDVKQLQHAQLRKSQAIDYKVNPPLQAPISYKENTRARLPGGTMYVDQTGTGQGIRSAFEVNLDLSHLLEDINDVRARIRSAYYEDLFLMLANDTRSGTTATEIAERHEEKLLMLGPVLERLHNELLAPLIDIAFDFAAEAGILPEVPKELAGRELNVEFVSTLAQAQRIVSAQGMDRLIATVGALASQSGDLSVWDKLDKDQVVDDYADMYGVNPEIVVPDDVVAQVRDQRAKQQVAQQTAASMPAMAETAKTASEIDPAALGNVMNQFTGYSTPAGA